MRNLLPVLFLVLLAGTSCGKDRVVNPRGTELGHGILVYAFPTSDSTHDHVFVVQPGGKGLRQITSGPYYDTDPRWSPDGKKILFTRGGYVEVMNADGTNIVNLTPGDFYDESPSWSPDGAQIEYQHGSMNQERPWDVWVMNADGSNPHLFMTTISTNQCMWVNWTPQGTLLGMEAGGIDLQSSPSDTSLTRILALYDPFEAYPRLAPNGDLIAFCTRLLDDPGDDDRHIYTARPDGSDIKRITGGVGERPVWSPDGTKIAFQRDHQIWIINADRSDSVQVPSPTLLRVFLSDWR